VNTSLKQKILFNTTITKDWRAGQSGNTRTRFLLNVLTKIGQLIG